MDVVYQQFLEFTVQKCPFKKNAVCGNNINRRLLRK